MTVEKQNPAYEACSFFIYISEEIVQNLEQTEIQADIQFQRYLVVFGNNKIY